MAAFTQHDNWSSRLTFLMAAIGAAVGLGRMGKQSPPRALAIVAIFLSNL